MALWRDATAGALGPGQGDYDPYGDLSSLVRQIAPGIGSAAQTALQPQFQRPDDSFAAYMADPGARSDADIQQRAAAGPPSVPQSLADLGSLVTPYLAGAAPGGSLSSGIRAWHASPYDFDKFDISKVGTGQGAATYGHGIYAAESPKVSGPGGSYDLEFTAKNLGKYDLNQGENEVLQVLRAGGSDMDVLGTLARGGGYTFEEANAVLERMKAAKARLYDVNINTEPSALLDWDKSLGQQSPEVQEALRRGGAYQGPSMSLGGDPAGAILKRAMASPYHAADLFNKGGDPLQLTPADVSQRLNEAGIPGIRYLDQQSRNAGGWHITPADQTVSGKWMVKSNDYNSQGMHFDTEAEAQKALQAKIGGQTSNYVVFDPKIIDILRKYAVPGLISGGGAAGIANAGSQ